MASYLLINKQTNIADSGAAWDGDTTKWSPPDTHIAVLVETTPAIDWVWNAETQEWDAVEGMGNGGFGDIWDGQKLVQPKPTEPPATPITPQQIGGGASVIE